MAPKNADQKRAFTTEELPQVLQPTMDGCCDRDGQGRQSSRKEKHRDKEETANVPATRGGTQIQDGAAFAQEVVLAVDLNELEAGTGAEACGDGRTQIKTRTHRV